MLRKGAPQKKIEEYQNKVTKNDLVMAITDIQRVCNFNPMLNTRGTKEALKNQIYIIASSLYPEDSKLFSKLTNWVLSKLGVRGWSDKVYLKPDKNTLLDYLIAARRYTHKDLPTYKYNNYDYPYKNVFAHMDVDSIAKQVHSLLHQEKYGTFREVSSVPKDKSYYHTLRVLKYIQFWCQLHNFDIRIGLDFSDKIKDYVTTNRKLSRLQRIEEEVRSGKN